MEKIKTQVRRIVYKVKYQWLRFDNVILVVCFGLCVFWTYGSIVSMSKNWVLEQNLADKERELEIIQLEVETQELENKYYASEEYQELSARAKLNKQLPGETMIFLPNNSDYAKEKHKNIESEIIEEEKSNFAEWMTFLFGI